MPVRNGSLRLFRFAGIDVYVHWSWLLVAYFQIQYRSQFRDYDKPIWNLFEYLTLFVIVLMHEFGHALACRQVGGHADEIMLWPLGGVAYVNPPPRPGAFLWSIAAGPLVNVFLVPVTLGFWLLSRYLDWSAVYPNLAFFLQAIFLINTGLLVFNLLPIYPLDGGQILQALLWFVIGRAHSLLVVCILGLIGSGGFVLLALLLNDWWLVVIAFFAASRALIGLRQARLLSRILSGPRHTEAACPSCGTAPLAGNFWRCDECGATFDTFAHRARCPNCFKHFNITKCPDCYKLHPIEDWFAAPPPHEEFPHYAPR